MHDDLIARLRKRQMQQQQRSPGGRTTRVVVVDDPLCQQAADALEAMQADARRYRWLRSRKGLDLRSDGGRWTRPDGTQFINSHYLAEGGTQHAAADGLDAAIDAAMNQPAGKD